MGAPEAGNGRRTGQVDDRLQRRIVDAEDKGLDADLDEALAGKGALDIINDDLLAGMRTVGELFGSGQMQLPFVLASAEVITGIGTAFSMAASIVHRPSPESCA